jgi:hypothetical protein
MSTRQVRAGDAAAQQDGEDFGRAWLRYMRRGNWELAWRISDDLLAARRGRPPDWTAPRHLQPVWDGSPLAGRRVLVRCYHGLGDTIQFIRLVPRLARIASAVTVWAQSALIPLLSSMPGLGELLSLHDGTPEVAYDVDVEVMELAHVFRVTPETLPATVPYLRPACPARSAATRDAVAGLAVGVIWRAAPYRRRCCARSRQSRAWRSTSSSAGQPWPKRRRTSACGPGRTTSWRRPA